jgi:hypothetical protein
MGLDRQQHQGRRSMSWEPALVTRDSYCRQEAADALVLRLRVLALASL